jgi:hypothetical protein
MTEITVEPVKKIRRKKTKVVTDEALHKSIAVLRGDDKKKANKVRRVLSAVPFDRLGALGVTEEELNTIPTDISRTFTFGILGSLFSGSDKIAIGDGTLSVLPHERDMRAAHEYYNTVVRATRPIFVTFNEFMDGEAQRSLRSYESRISDEYAAIREINQKNRKRTDSPEVTQHLETIKKLKAERNPLYEAARKERREYIKANPAALEAANKALTDMIRTCRHSRPEGIWHGAYSAVEAAFSLSRQKAIENGILPRLRDEWKGEADNFLTNHRWNGEGKINASHSSLGGTPEKTHEFQTWASIMAGKNKMMTVRKFLPSDLAAHGLKPNFKIRDDMYLVSIRRGDRKDVSFVSAGVILHRQPQPMDRIVLSSFVIRKNGLKHVVTLNLSVKMQTGTTVGQDVAYILPKWERQGEDVVAAEWKKGNICGELVAPFYTPYTPPLEGHKKGKRGGLFYQTEHAASLDKIVSRILSTINSVRVEYGLEPEKRGDLRYIGRTSNPIVTPLDGVNPKEAFSKVAAEVRALEDAVGPYGGAGESATKDFVDTVYMKLTKLFSFPDRAQGLNFVTGWLFRERYHHLYPWAVNERSKSLLHRREIHRIFASTFAGAKEIHIPNTDYRTRFMSDEQKLVSPSELLTAIRNFAEREGIAVIEENEEEIIANLQSIEIAEGFANPKTDSNDKAFGASAGN